MLALLLPLHSAHFGVCKNISLGSPYRPTERTSSTASWLTCTLRNTISPWRWSSASQMARWYVHYPFSWAWFSPPECAFICRAWSERCATSAVLWLLWPLWAVLCSQGCCDRQTAASALPRSLIHVFLFWNRTTTVGEKNNKKWTTSAYISSLTFVGVGGILKAIVAFFPASIVPCVNVPLKSLLGSSF